MENSYKKKFKKKESWRKKKDDMKKWKDDKLEEAISKKKPKLEIDSSTTLGGVDNCEKNPVAGFSGRIYTVSIALPGSILDNAQSNELRTYLAGQIARAAAIFHVDEIVVFDENSCLTQNQFESIVSGEHSSLNDSNECRTFRCNSQLVKILQFLECPQYLRKHLFPLHKDLQYAGLLNPLDCLHHFRSDDLSIPYREGVVLDKPTKSLAGSYCNAGLCKDVLIDEPVERGIRVTLKLELGQEDSASSKHHYKGKVVSPLEPTRKGGYYWGYNVRLARNVTAVFEECPFPSGYDLCVGTSEKGRNLDEIGTLPEFKHLLIVFGGVKGLESCVENDQSTASNDPANLFQLYLNTCPDQGSRTIRTEEAILITLSGLRRRICQSGAIE